jgi:hypothetical protein
MKNERLKLAYKFDIYAENLKQTICFWMLKRRKVLGVDAIIHEVIHRERQLQDTASTKHQYQILTTEATD